VLLLFVDEVWGMYELVYGDEVDDDDDNDDV
jgi:hypothetical protein